MVNTHRSLRIHNSLRFNLLCVLKVIIIFSLLFEHLLSLSFSSYLSPFSQTITSDFPNKDKLITKRNRTGWFVVDRISSDRHILLTIGNTSFLTFLIISYFLFLGPLSLVCFPPLVLSSLTKTITGDLALASRGLDKRRGQGNRHRKNHKRRYY